MKTALKTKIVIVFLTLLTFCGAMFLFAFNAKTTFAEPVVKDYWSWSSSTQIDQKTTTLPDATVGESYSVSISGPFDGDTFPVYSATIKNSQNQEVTDFGTGLLIDTIDAYSISGTPTVAGTYTIFVDNYLGGHEAYSFTINPAGFTISFDTDGGTSIEDLTGQTTLPTPFPSTSKTGYTFVGWYLDDEFKNAAVCNTPITANTTLYAKYTEDIEINTSVQRYVFDGNQHTAQLKDKSGNPITLDGFTYTIKRQYATGTEAVEVSDCIEPAQYLFYFYRDADDTYSQVDGTFIYVIVTYSITYKVNGGDGEDFVDICENPNYDIYYYGNDDYNGGKKLEPSFTTFTKEHYVFYGWNDKADGTGNQYKSATSYDITSNMTLYAIYTPVLVQPNSSNNYTVGVTTTDSVEYQWYKRTTVYTPFTDSSKLEYGSLNAETGVVSSSSNRVRFSFRGEIIFKSDATLTGLTSTDGVYYARSYRFAFIDVSSSSNFTIYDVKVISYVDAILPTETSSSLSCGTENASYYCNVRSLKYNTTISSNSITPTTISFVGGEGTTGTKPSDLYQLQTRTISLPNNPFTKTGISFIGWNDGTTTYKEGFIYTVGSTKVTFTAKFGHTCNGCDFDIPLDSTFEGGDIGSGHYYLTSDITITTDITTEPKSEVVICLNGHILNLNGHQLYCYDGYLELYDCNDDEANVHNYKVNANGVWVLTTDAATKTLSSLNSTPKENDVIAVKGGAIVGGVGQYYGGAVYCGKHLIAKNVSFIGNHSTDEAGKKGGAINSNKATIINCQFYGNRSIEGSSIYGAKVNIYYSTFKFNSTYQVEVEQEPYGGSGTIFNNGTLLLEHSTIQYNQGFKGSAIFLDRDYNPIATIIDSTITDNLATEKGGAITIDNPGCFKEGTLITMGDGSEKAIEEIKVGDLVKSFNHETGLYESNPIYYIYTNYEYAECIKLTFESGNTLTIVDCHDLFNQEANKYVTINSSNAESYINKYFYNSSLNSGNGGWDQLISVSCTGEYVTYYSIYVGYTANCLANGLLTCPDDNDARLNIYKFGADLVADATQLQADIATYGLKEFNDCTLIKSETAYEMFCIKYYNLYIGKGLITERELNNAFYEVCDGSEYTTGVSGNSIIIGQNTTIQNNKVNNVENNLDLSADNQIVVLEDAKNINVGITLQSTIGLFAQNVYANNIGFTSDNPVYGVKCKQTGTTYSYSISVLKEEPSKANDYTVVLDDSIKDNYKYQWYEGYGVKEFSNLNSSEYAFEYSNDVCGNTIDSIYIEEFIESSSGHVVNFYFSNAVECFIYFDCSIGSIVANDKYTSFVYYEGNSYVAYCDDGEFSCFSTSEEFSLENVRVQIVTTLTSETKAKIGTTTLSNASYFCHIYDTSDKLVETSTSIKPKEVSFAGGDGATGSAPTTIYQLDGRKTTLPANTFVNTGYKFTNWKNGTTYAVGSEYTVGSSNVTFTATWTEKKTVSITQTAQSYLFGLENVKFEIKGTTLTGFDVKYKRSTSVTTQVPTGIGYYDVVIHRDECADYKAFDLTITNGFGRYCTVTYLKGDEASGTAPEDSNKYFSYEFDYTILDNTTIQRTGYNFVGWKEQSDTNGIIYKPGFEYNMGTKNYTYVPVWELKLKEITKDNNYTVSFDATDLITQSYQWLKFVSIPLDEIPTSVYSFYDEGPYGIIGTKKANNTITSHYENGLMAQAIFMIIDKNAVNQYTTLSFKSNETALFNIYALEGYETISKDNSGVYTIKLSQTTLTEGCYYVYISNSQDSETTFDVTDFHFNNMSVAIENETQSKLQNVSEATGYYCGVTYKTMENGIEVTKTSYTNVVTPKTISFNANGATSGTTPSTVYQLEGRKVTLPQLTLTKDGYTFGGWVVETTSYNPGTELLVPSNDIEVCANWEQNKQVVGDKTEPDVKPTVEVSLKDNDNGIPTTITVVVEVTVEVEVETKELTVNYYKLDESNAKLSDDEKVGVVFDVKLIQTIDGVSREIQPSDIKEGTTIKVKMLIPDTVDISKVTRILHVHSASDIEVIDFDPSKVDENGYYEIEVDRLSEFAFIYVKDCKIHYILIATLSLLILFVLILWFACKIRSFREKSIKSLIPGIGFTIHLIIMTVIRIFMGECKTCAIIHLVNLVVLALFVLLYMFYKPHKETPTTLKEAMSLASEVVQSNSLVNKKSVADFLDEQFKENVLTNRRENYIKSGILPLADTHYKVTSEKKTCFIYVYELRNGNTFFLVKCNPKLAKQIKKKHSSFNASAFPKTKNHDWYTMIVDESYENTEEVFDVLKQIFDEQ